MKRIFFAVCLFLLTTPLALYAADLEVLATDLFVERNSGRSIGTSKDGFNVYVRKKEGVQSVMFVETTKDPLGQEDNFAYRAPQYNSLNGDEQRNLDGKPLTSPYAKNSLISSTVTTHPRLGECFLIYVPPTLIYGYPWTRNGEVTVAKGTFVNIRTFTEKYGDYTGEFKDNPFMFDFPERTPEKEIEPEPVVLTDDYNPTAAESFSSIASDTNGKTDYSKGADALPQDLEKLVDALPHSNLDLIFAIDATGSMKDDIESLKKNWIPRFKNQVKDFDSLRLGLVFYQDYNDSFSYKGLPVKLFAFTESDETFTQNLNSVSIRGNEGGDTPEAVYEALYAAIHYFAWREDAQKRIILIGDAEPHPRPRGSKKITGEAVREAAKEKGICIQTVLLPK